jgi:AraC family transcriptional regulator
MECVRTLCLDLEGERACQHLRKDRLPLKEIALVSGFSDQSHLNRMFRRHKNITPAQYRKQCTD